VPLTCSCTPLHTSGILPHIFCSGPYGLHASRILLHMHRIYLHRHHRRQKHFLHQSSSAVPRISKPKRIPYPVVYTWTTFSRLLLSGIRPHNVYILLHRQYMHPCNFEIFRGSFCFLLVVNFLSNSLRVLSQLHQNARHAVRRSVSRLLGARKIDREQFQAALTVGVELDEICRKREVEKEMGIYFHTSTVCGSD
jgi:hypothetical protein